LLTAYIKRLTETGSRPLAPLEVLWVLVEELGVETRPEEQKQGEALRQAIDAVWAACDQSEDRFIAFSRTPVDQIAQSPDAEGVLNCLLASDTQLTRRTAAELLQGVLGWMQAPVPVVQALCEALERTEAHTLLTPNDDLSLSRPGYLGNAETVATLHGVLGSALRPTMLRQGELLSPMEATIYHQPEPGSPSFVEIGMEVSVGQTLALLEAMKMFSELPSPVDGVVVDILVENGQGVKTGEPLFKIMTQDEASDTAEDALPHLTHQTVQNRFRLL
jgi:biotin carboxyl carrier protein